MKYGTHVLKELYSEGDLHQIKEGLLKLSFCGPILEESGICVNLEKITGVQVLPFVKFGCVGWNGLARPALFPVPVTIEERERRWWEGRALEHRQSLIKHLIGVCDKLLEENSNNA